MPSLSLQIIFQCILGRALCRQAAGSSEMRDESSDDLQEMGERIILNLSAAQPLRCTMGLIDFSVVGGL
jgi:hypothetical protein